jgi:RING finger protein 121
MIGKKDTCPYCSEKVSLKQVFKNPWEKQGILWAHLMDALRYLIVWNPIILFSVQGFLYFVDPGA